MVAASLVLDRKLVLDGGWIIQMRVLRLPETSAERPHGLNYSLFYGRGGERVIGYDNKAGKGDHRHDRHRQKFYAFTSLEQMIRDFQADVRRERTP